MGLEKKEEIEMKQDTMIVFFIVKSDMIETSREVNTYAFDNGLIIKDVKVFNDTTIIVIFEVK